MVLLTLYLVQLIAQVVQSSLVEPAYESAEDAIDDHHGEVALDPILLR